MTLRSLARDLELAGVRAEAAVRELVEHAGAEITEDARSRIEPSRHPHLPYYADSITFDVDTTITGTVRAEIGPDADLPQGQLGEIIERGSATSNPVPHLGPAADDHVPGLAREIGLSGLRVLW